MGNVKPEDAGEWTCEMESYVFGIARGTVRKKGMQVSIDTAPPSTTVVVKSSTSTEITPLLNAAVTVEESDAGVTSTTPSLGIEPRILEDVTEGHGNNDTDTSSPFQTDHDNDSSDQAQVSVDDSGEEQPPSYAGIIVGIFFGIFIVMLVIAFFGYRQYRRQNKGLGGKNWEGLSRDEDDVEESATAAEPFTGRNARLELNDIVEEEGEK